MRLLGSLTARDLYLLDVLEAHRVLTAEQVADLLFPSLDRAQRRLLQLTQRGVLARFRACVRPGSQPWRYTLGYPAVVLLAAARAERPPTRAAHDLSIARLARSRQLDHLLGVNGLFTALTADAAPRPGARLLSWYSEPTTHTLLPQADRFRIVGVHPDAYGRWAESSHAVSFLLEHDTGTEPLGRLLDKLTAYDTHRHFGMSVLLHLPSTARETNLHHKAAQPRGYPVATTAADLIAAGGHSPAGPVWLPLGSTGRRRLLDLAHPAATSLWADARHGTTPPPGPHLPLVA